MNERKKQELIFFFLACKTPIHPAIAPARTAAQLSVPVSAQVFVVAQVVQAVPELRSWSGSSELVERLRKITVLVGCAELVELRNRAGNSIYQYFILMPFHQLIEVLSFRNCFVFCSGLLVQLRNCRTATGVGGALFFNFLISSFTGLTGATGETRLQRSRQLLFCFLSSWLYQQLEKLELAE